MFIAEECLAMELEQKPLTIISDGPGALSVCEHDDDWLSLESLLNDSEELGGMVVRSGAMRRVVQTIRRLAPYKATVLVYGESGTGKELVARALHQLGPSPKGPFVTFNCSNLVESLAESQLFGHVRGAFTDAREEALGYFRAANGGTLFLDEIGELPLRLQPKLLRAVESHEVQPVGGTQSHKVDIRLIAATNRDLRAMVKAGEFRDDLYYRLSASAVRIPPLRERRDALEALAAHFLGHYNRLFGKRLRYISRRALAALAAYDWPGNVREFAHAMQSAAMLSDNDRICIGDLPDFITAGEPETQPEPEIDEATPAEKSARFSLDEVINRASKTALIQALREAGGNCHRAAQLLGVSRYTVYRMLARYGIAPNRERTRPNLHALPGGVKG
jgi:transcriptional regulator with GAF, ATPase, and Fis domain